MRTIAKLIIGSQLILNSAAFAGAREDQIGRYLKPLKVPGKVARAVADIDAQGRSESDFAGIQRFETFEIVDSSAKQTIKKILTDVIEYTKKEHGEFSLAAYCVKGLDEQDRELNLENAAECAEHLVGYNEVSQLENHFGMLRTTYEAGSEASVRMNKNLGHVQKHIRKLVGDDYIEISTAMPALNYDELYSVLINKKTKHVVIVKYDLGA